LGTIQIVRVGIFSAIFSRLSGTKLRRNFHAIRDNIFFVRRKILPSVFFGMTSRGISIQRATAIFSPPARFFRADYRNWRRAEIFIRYATIIFLPVTRFFCADEMISSASDEREFFVCIRRAAQPFGRS
jgi:hypothetical protein